MSFYLYSENLTNMSVLGAAVPWSGPSVRSLGPVPSHTRTLALPYLLFAHAVRLPRSLLYY